MLRDEGRHRNHKVPLQDSSSFVGLGAGKPALKCQSRGWGGGGEELRREPKLFLFVSPPPRFSKIKGSYLRLQKAAFSPVPRFPACSLLEAQTKPKRSQGTSQLQGCGETLFPRTATAPRVNTSVGSTILD